MAESTSRRKASRRKSEPSNYQSSSKRPAIFVRPVAASSPSQTRKAGVAYIAKYCCLLQNAAAGGTATHGSGFIVKLEGLQSAKLLALDCKKRGKIGELETDYVLITSHDTIPGLSLSELNGWTVSCQAIESGNEQTLSDLVCGVISCCGHESFIGPGHSDARIFLPHPNVSCQVELNITILFLNSTFEKLCMRQGVQESSAYTVLNPPLVSVQKCLDQDVFSQEHQQIISTVSSDHAWREQAEHRHSIHVYYCNGPRLSSLKATEVLAVDQQDTTEHNGEISHDIAKFEKFQKLYYRESNSSLKPALVGRCYGSPVVYYNTDTNESSVIGVHAGETGQKGQYVAVTLHGILQLLQGGLIPVLSVLRCFETPRLWTSRWVYLVIPQIEQIEQMNCGFICEVLQYLLKDRFGTQLVKLSVDLADVDNKAALDLLCALFKHFEAASDADLDKVVTKLYDECYGWRVEDDIKQLCISLLNLLEGAAREPKQKEITPTAEGVSLPDRTTLVEKCLIFYNRLLDFKYRGITEEVLCTFVSHELVEKIGHDQRYQSPAVKKLYEKISRSQQKLMQQAVLRKPAKKKKHTKKSVRSVQPPELKRKRAASAPSFLSPVLKENYLTAEETQAEEPQVELSTAGSDRVEIKHQNVQTEPVEIKDQLVQTKAASKEQTHIRGTEVIAQKTFTLTQEEVDLNFEGYGFKLHVPENSLPAEVTETQLNVRVSLSGPFQMLFNSKLLSAVYWVSSPHKFEKPITVEIQHCAVLSSDKQCSKLTFVRTKCTQKELPYTFKELVGGVFSPHSSYGSLSLSQFCGIAIASTPSPELQPQQQQPQPQTAQIEQEMGGVVEQYCAQLYNARQMVNEWKVIFVVTKDLESCSTVVKKEYSSHAHQQFSFNFTFKEEFVSLDIPQTGLQLDEWKITPFYYPINRTKDSAMVCVIVNSLQIKREQVNLFNSGKNIPKCELVLEWGQDTPPTLLHHSVGLLGADDPHNYFLLRVNPGAAFESTFMVPTTTNRNPPVAENRPTEEPRVELNIGDLFEVTNYLLHLGENNIYNLGLTLGLDYPRLKNMKDSETFRDDMIAAWLLKEDQVTAQGVPTWETLVKALRHPRVNQTGVAERIEAEKNVTH